MKLAQLAIHYQKRLTRPAYFQKSKQALKKTLSPSLRKPDYCYTV